MEDLILYKKPELLNPRMIIGLDGWPNAGKVSTNVVKYLIRKLGARKFAEIRPDNFYVFSSTRPLTSIEEGELKDFTLPASEFSYWKDEMTLKDLIFLLAVEPDLRWYEYADVISHLARDYQVRRIYTLGGVGDYVSHKEEPRVSAVVNDPKLKKDLEQYQIEFIDYQGSSSFHAFLHSKKEIEVISLWGTVPIYLSQNPKVYHAVLQRLVPLLELDLDLEDMREASEKMDEEVNKLVTQNPKLKEFIEDLEKSYEADLKPPPSFDIERLMRDIEGFLRKEKGDEIG